MKLWLPKIDDYIEVTEPWRIESNAIAQELKRCGQDHLIISKNYNALCEIPAGTIIKFTSMYMNNGNLFSVTFKDGPFKRMVRYVHVSVDDFRTLSFKEANVEVKAKAKSIIKWEWSEFNSKVGDKTQNPPESLSKLTGNSVMWADTEISYGRITGDDWWKPRFSAVNLVYADYKMREESLHGLAKTTKIIFEVIRTEYSVFDRDLDVHIGLFKNQDAVRKAVKKYIKDNNIKTRKTQ